MSFTDTEENIGASTVSYTSHETCISFRTLAQQSDRNQGYYTDDEYEYDEKDFFSESEEKYELETSAKQTPTLRQICDALPLSPETFLSDMVGNIVHSYIGNPFVISLCVYTGFVYFPQIGSETGELVIDWGDDKQTILKAGEIGHVDHVYFQAGTHIVCIEGDVTHLCCAGMSKLVDISQWGNLRLLHGEEVFSDCKNLTVTAQDSPNLCYTSSLNGMFRGCKSLIGDFRHWNVSNILDMSFMFSECEQFTSDLGEWDVSNCEMIQGMFNGCINFTSNLSNWDVSKVENMSKLFNDCFVFNSDLSRWDVRKVQNMGEMFSFCTSFNSDLSRWDVSKVENMDYMFANCVLFNADLSKWDVSSAATMSHMFIDCKEFNSDISEWNVRNVRFMDEMFSGCQKFNSKLSEWNVQNAEFVNGMFSGCPSLVWDPRNWELNPIIDVEEMFR